MKCPMIFSLAALCLLGLTSHASAQRHRMIKLSSRQNQQYHHPVPVVSDPAARHEAKGASSSSSWFYSSSHTSSSPPSIADPSLSLTVDSDADFSVEHEESMRLFMLKKAESVIASHLGTSFSSSEVDSILSGSIPPLHPGSLENVTWTMDMFESGNVLPTVSSHTESKPVLGGGALHLLSISSDHGASPDVKSQGDVRDFNNDGVVSIDEFLDSFFHADGVKDVFTQLEAKTKQHLGKQGKKEIIKKTAPVLHKTIEKVASHRGWGVQDARFASIHIEDEGQQANAAKGAFQDYNTFVKTMRNALVTPVDAAKDEVKEQKETPRTDPANKA
ncbi:hypothetical protein NDA11_001459 [Ustilago hordei]|uniref:EF-hand domain-containing protein n=1 Tax=Ustilago hordei TaxID=120017 RepID=I2G2P8_USTHO|nr:uncharacterized protein UHO2_02684 [Ustilago hordei]KAJ1040364.1 hypothetical protein NDA10_001093 [Ustilago hordei]KAJ1585265.1 hypothetical protein NDA15_004675 [Ustilago hordei]KAJ1588452.1 hypothetical protein NDA12_007576 [Ustilago hordei]KAJ1592768.1 hypothetical protein NDA11_001459 [Ustilago hordei]KAJ1601598.1 hypothetical protein NDA14_004446 [Ustilago hordei]